MSREEMLTDLIEHCDVPTMHMPQLREMRDALKRSRESAAKKRAENKATAYRILHSMLTNEEQTADELYKKFLDDRNLRNRYGKIITSAQKVRYALLNSLDFNPRNCDYEVIRANRCAMTFKLRG